MSWQPMEWNWHWRWSWQMQRLLAYTVWCGAVKIARIDGVDYWYHYN